MFKARDRKETNHTHPQVKMAVLGHTGLLRFLLATMIVGTRGDAVPPEGCNRTCGGLAVPYPFGFDFDVSDECYIGSRGGFNLSCNHSFNPPKAFQGDTEVISINLPANQATILLNLSYNCYNSTSEVPSYWRIWKTSLAGPYTLSSTQNVFTAIGCETLARFKISQDNFAGCISGCNAIDSVEEGNCTGIGCCQASIPKGVRWLNTDFYRRYNGSKTYMFNPCSYFFISEKNNYTFRKSDLRFMDTHRSFPVVLDFTVSGETCAQASAVKETYLCRSNNSECIDSSSDNGYGCRCSQGYEGNPYLLGGCTDIDECKHPEHYPCFGGICTNLPGRYNCTCHDGYYSEDPKKFTCKMELKPGKANLSLATKLVIGIGVGLLGLLLVGSFCCLELQRRKHKKDRQMYFDNHGGSFLQKLLWDDGSIFKIFPIEELKKATNDFDKERVIGSGGFGTVYKGTLDDRRVIAVKRSKSSTEKNGKDFANELFILSKINHRNIVELLGCCLEDEVPMLVYKFIPKGSLFHFLHAQNRQPIPFATRLRIATESAEALKYLHSDASTPILHGDVKSLNVLLDEGYVAKISDFGTSRLAPQDRAQFTTLVQGTYGYLDPEYMGSGQLTDKSDVYSFGVMLLEIMTRKLPFDFEGARPEQPKSLATKFVSCMENDNLNEILDPEVVQGGLSYEVLKVMDLAFRCLSNKGKDRPTMEQVVLELKGLKVAETHPWSPNNDDDSRHLLQGQNMYSQAVSTGNYASLNIEQGR